MTVPQFPPPPPWRPYRGESILLAIMAFANAVNFVVHGNCLALAFALLFAQHAVRLWGIIGSVSYRRTQCRDS